MVIIMPATLNRCGRAYVKDDGARSPGRKPSARDEAGRRRTAEGELFSPSRRTKDRWPMTKHKRDEPVDAVAAGEGPRPRMKEKEYQHELRRLHGELVAMQEWVKTSGAKICIVFEGRDTAGKGGTIKAITQRVSPRVFRVIALSAPTERERSQMFLQRYVPHLPGAGDVVLFDRSWYNRAGVERVLGFCDPDQVQQFLRSVPEVERAIVDSGVILLKYWLEVSPAEQTRRLQNRINDPRKVWKLSDLDLESYGRWYDYSRARDDMFRATDTAWAPWYVAHTDDKKRGRLNIITHLLANVPYEPLKHRDVVLPKQQKSHGYQEPALTVTHIPEPF
jgi:polyphosphate kinase